MNEFEFRCAGDHPVIYKAVVNDLRTTVSWETGVEGYSGHVFYYTDHVKEKIAYGEWVVQGDVYAA